MTASVPTVQSNVTRQSPAARKPMAGVGVTATPAVESGTWNAFVPEIRISPLAAARGASSSVPDIEIFSFCEVIVSPAEDRAQTPATGFIFAAPRMYSARAWQLATRARAGLVEASARITGDEG